MRLDTSFHMKSYISIFSLAAHRKDWRNVACAYIVLKNYLATCTGNNVSNILQTKKLQYNIYYITITKWNRKKMFRNIWLQHCMATCENRGLINRKTLLVTYYIYAYISMYICTANFIKLRKLYFLVYFVKAKTIKNSKLSCILITVIYMHIYL